MAINSIAVRIAVQIIHYLHPSTIIISRFIPSTRPRTTQINGISNKYTHRKRCNALCLMFLLILAYISQAMAVLYRSATQQDWWPSNHSLFHIIVSIFIWVALDLDLLDTSEPAWPKYYRSWILSCLFEASLCFLELVLFSKSQKSLHNIALFALQVSRVICSIALGLNATFMRQPAKTQDSAENRWLLANEPTERRNYGSFPISHNETEDSDAVTKERQRKRLEDQGWFSYFTDFRIFLRCLWPFKGPRGCFYLAFLFADLVINRLLKVLIPRKLGIITDNLFDRNFDMACNETVMWIFLSWLKHRAGPLGVIKSVVLLEAHDFSYQEVCRLAFKHVMTLSMDFHSNKESAEIMKAVEQGNSIGHLAELLLLDIPPVFLDLIVAIWYISSLFDRKVAFATFLFAVLYVCVSITLTNWTQPRRRIYTEASRTERNVVNESLSGWPIITYFGRLKFEEERYMGAVQDAVSAKRAYRHPMILGDAVETMIVHLGWISTLLLAIREISSGEASVGDFVTIGIFYASLTYPLEMIVWSHSHLTSIFIDAERLLHLLLTKPSVEELSNPYSLDASSRRIEFRNVEFFYSPTGKKILNGIYFDAIPGQTIAFVGKTGSGKSTILNLVCRFYDVTGGSILIGGRDVRDVSLDSLRDVVGAVPQDQSLFNRTILENVRYSKPDATDEEVFEACSSAALHEDIISRPGGYNFKVGERGVKLSGGERQRLAIARVILKKPDIMIFDEATSAMDSSTEAKVQEALQKLQARQPITFLVVAHRLSTIEHADLILFIKNGEIVERGRHQELLRKKGEYFRHWKHQNRSTEQK